MRLLAATLFTPMLPITLDTALNLIWLGLGVALFLLLLLLPQSQCRQAALVLSIVIFIASLGLLIAPAKTNLLWIPSLDIHFHLASDGLSIWLVLLSTFLTPIAVLVSWKYIDHRVKFYYSLLLLLEFGLVGVFLGDLHLVIQARNRNVGADQDGVDASRFQKVLYRERFAFRVGRAIARFKNGDQIQFR